MQRSAIVKSGRLAGMYAVCVLIAVVVLGPILITVFTSVKTRGGMVHYSVLAPPPIEGWTWENYKKVLFDPMLPGALLNSSIIIAISLFFNIIFGSVTAYCLERFNFRLKKVIFALFFTGMLVPTFVTEIGRFKLIDGLHLYNTLGAPIVIYVATDLMQLFIYRQFISRIHVSLDESAIMDGAGYFTVFGQIIFPLLAPATATLVIVKAVGIINDMYIPYLYMPSKKLKTMTTFLMSYANAQQGSWQVLSAAIIVIMIPTVIIYVVFQKYIFDGMTMGAVKE